MILVLFLVATSIIGYYLIHALKKQLRFYRSMLKLPGPPANFFLKYYNQPEKIFNLVQEFNRRYYPIYRIQGLHRMAANILSPEDCEIVLTSPLHNTKGSFYNFLKNWLNDGLLISDGSKWQHRRKILTSAFHFSILQQFIQIFNNNSRELVQVLMTESNKPYVNITKIISNFMLKTIAETAMGTSLQFKTEKERNYKNAILTLGEIIIYHISCPWFTLKGTKYFSPKFMEEIRANRILHSFTKEMIQNRQKENSGKITSEYHDVYKDRKRLAMLDLLIDCKKKGLIDDCGIQEEVDTFLFEGHDTTAMSLTYLLFLLACHPECQKRILQEMNEVLLGDIHKNPEYTDLQNMKYLERCMKESLRLFPVVHFISRILGEDIVTHSGYTLLKGTEVFIHILAMHRSPEIYPNPEKFDPDRFLPENVKERHPFAYLPFSAGSRNCIGQKFAILELKSVVCAILANFVLEPVDGFEQITLVPDIVLRTKNPIKVKFVRRG